MDQGLKERLVGAAVLVAIGVWLIPWVLDGPESGLDSPTSSLQLPAAEEPMPMRTQTLRLGDQPAPASESPPVEVSPEPPAAAAEVAPPLESAAPAEPPSAEPRAAAVPVVVAAPPRPAPAAAAPAAASGDWIVQLGSFGEEANARRLAQRAGTFGYDADVSSYRSDGRTLYRVRVGPATTRGRADATASALRAHGIEARVVAR